MAHQGLIKSTPAWRAKRRFYQDDADEKPQLGPYDGLADVLPDGIARAPRSELARGVAPARHRRIR